MAGYPPYPVGGGVPAPHNDPLVPPDFGGWFNRVFGVFRRSWKPLLILQVMAVAVGALVGVAQFLVVPDRARLGAEIGQAPATGPAIAVYLVGLVISLVANAFIASASVVAVVRDAVGHPTGALAALRLGTSRAFPLLGWCVVGGLMMAVTLGITAVIPLIGPILFLAVLLYLGVVFGASLLGVVVIERGTLGRCFALVGRRFWPTVGRLVLLGLIAAVYALVAVIVPVLLAVSGTTPVLSVILAVILLLPLWTLVPAVGVVTYSELRFREDGVTSTASLAAEMSR